MWFDKRRISAYLILGSLLVQGFTTRTASGIGGPGDLFYTTDGPPHRLLHVDGVTGQFLELIQTAGQATPTGLTFGPDGYLYVAWSSNRTVLRYDVTTATNVGTFVEPEAGDLSSPWGIVFGPNGNLFIADWGRSSVKEYDGASGQRSKPSYRLRIH